MKLKRSIYLTLITFLLLLPFNIYSETSKTNSISETKNGQIIIRSISMELDMKNSVLAFMGDVDVQGDDMNMSCQKLELFSKGSLKEGSKEESKPDLEKIVATESVVITRPDGGRATADRAEYYPDSEKIVLTGDPYLKYGDRIEGGGPKTKITLYIKEERFIVEGTKEDKATVKYRIETGEEER